MKKIITYGTYDLFHEGHYNLLKRAKELGDYLIVGVTTDNYDKNRGKLNVQNSLIKRIEDVKKTGFVDEIIIEEYEGQKVNDILKYGIDIFAIGSDWTGKFDYLKNFCEVVYLPRTKGISSTQLRNMKNRIIRLGIAGAGRIAKRFIKESKYVSGVNVEGVFSRSLESANKLVGDNELNFVTVDYNEFLERIDAVYIATPHLTHFEYAKKAILNNKHVLCEKPMVLTKEQAIELFYLAKERNLVFLEAIKTAYCPAFIRLIDLARSGVIGNIKAVDATFTKLTSGNVRELDYKNVGGSVTELATYPLMAITKLLGNEIKDINYYSYIDRESNIDLFTKINILYKGSIATANIGLGVKSEGSLVISGTKGYIYVPAPWWKTEYFETRFEDYNDNKRYFYKFEGDGLRYEISEFLSMIIRNEIETYKLRPEESIYIIELIEKYISRQKIISI